MIHPIVFKDKCSCGGNLFFVKSDNSTTETIENAGEVIGIKCKKCNVRYPIRWNIENGEPYPILDEELELKKFMEEYSKE